LFGNIVVLKMGLNGDFSANLGGKDIVVGSASSAIGTIDDPVVFVVFALFFGGPLHEQQYIVNMLI
jgi:hypothetical protein